MTGKRVYYGREAKDGLLRGINKVADAVAATLGPSGRNVLFHARGYTPKSTKDGVTVARNLSFPDPLEDAGAQMCIQAAVKSNEVGDGTTTSTILSRDLATQGLQAIDDNENVVEVKKGMDATAIAVVEYLKSLAKEVNYEDIDSLRFVARVAANESTLGDVVAEAFHKAGADGAVISQEQKAPGYRLEYVEGLQIDRGMVSPYFINQSSKYECILEHAIVVLIEKNLTDAREMVAILTALIEKHPGKPIVLIAGGISGGALEVIINNHQSQEVPLNCCAMVAPSFGDRMINLMEDIAAYTGGIFIRNTMGVSPLSILTKGEGVGTVGRIIIGRDSTIILSGGGDKSVIAERVNLLKSEYESEEAEYDKDVIAERISKLCGGVSVVHYGASTGVELSEIKDRLDDSIKSTRAALDGGVIPGGGIGLLRAYEFLGDLNYSQGLTPSYMKGVEILRKALLSPISQLAHNAGADSEYVLENISKHKNVNFGWNSKTNRFNDMFEEGVVDPFKVTASALLNAVSVAGTLLITEATVINEVEIAKNEGK